MVLMATDPRLPGARGLRCWPRSPTRCPTSRARRPSSPRSPSSSTAPAAWATLFYVLLQVGTTLILDPGRQHQLHRLPLPGQLRRRGLLPAPPADQARPPAGLLHRDHRPHRGLDHPARGSPRPRWTSSSRSTPSGCSPASPWPGPGMAKYHLSHREDHWRRRLAINGTASVLSVHRPDHHRRVQVHRGGLGHPDHPARSGSSASSPSTASTSTRSSQLEEGAAEAAEAPVLNRHVVIVLVDRLDMATARALQYARTLHPDELRAVHFTLDDRVSAELESEWGRLGLTQLPLDVEECEDRRLTRAALELAAETVADGQTELTILLPRRGFAAGWHRLLHDATADQIAAAVGQLAHVNATVVPYQLTGGWLSRRREWRRGAGCRPVGPGRRPGSAGPPTGPPTGRPATGRLRPGGLRRAGRGAPSRSARPSGAHRVRVAGRVKSVRVQPRAGTVQPRVRPGRRHRQAPPRVPGPAPHPGHPARGPAGGRGDGGRLGPPPGHPQPRLRAHRRSRGRRRADLTGAAHGPLRDGRVQGSGVPSLPTDPYLSVSSGPVAGYGVP